MYNLLFLDADYQTGMATHWSVWYSFSIDLKDAYLHIAIVKHHQNPYFSFVNARVLCYLFGW